MGDVDKLIGEVDMGLELGGLKKPENFSRAAVVSSKPSPSGGAQPSKDFSSFEVGQMENGFTQVGPILKPSHMRGFLVTDLG